MKNSNKLHLQLGSWKLNTGPPFIPPRRGKRHRGTEEFDAQMKCPLAEL